MVTKVTENMQDPANGGGAGLVLLSTATASNNTTIDFTSFIDSTYEEYEVHIINMTVSIDSTIFGMQMSDDGGSTFKAGASDYSWMIIGGDEATPSPDGYGSAGSTYLHMSTVDGIGNASGEHYNSVIKVFNPANASFPTAVTTQIYEDNWNYGFISLVMVGKYNTASAIDGFRLAPGSGLIASGEFKLYGVVK